MLQTNLLAYSYGYGFGYGLAWLFQGLMPHPVPRHVQKTSHIINMGVTINLFRPGLYSRDHRRDSHCAAKGSVVRVARHMPHHQDLFQVTQQIPSNSGLMVVCRCISLDWQPRSAKWQVLATLASYTVECQCQCQASCKQVFRRRKGQICGVLVFFTVRLHSLNSNFIVLTVVNSKTKHRQASLHYKVNEKAIQFVFQNQFIQYQKLNKPKPPKHYF